MGDRLALACGIDRHDTCAGLLDGRPCGCACHEEESDFACPWAPERQARCPTGICDCFIDTHPDSPFDLHPEDFVVDEETA